MRIIKLGKMFKFFKFPKKIFFFFFYRNYVFERLLDLHMKEAQGISVVDGMRNMKLPSDNQVKPKLTVNFFKILLFSDSSQLVHELH